MPITQRITKRVATQGASGAIPSSLGGNTWGGSWGGTWGNVWLFGTPESPATGEEPAIDITRRIGTRPTANITSRVPRPLLILEGDESGYLLLDGDVQFGGDAFALEGDEALIIAANHTRRVAA